MSEIKMRVIEPEEMRRVTIFMKNFEQATKFVTVDIDHATETYERMIRNGIMTVIILEKGFDIIGSMAFLVTPDLHNGIITAVETYWFTHPDYRIYGIKLYNAFERLAKKQGATRLAMVHLIDSYPEKLEKFYAKKGYELIEKHYIKEL
jgi:GNAT superfamily N-acetyltransferase